MSCTFWFLDGRWIDAICEGKKGKWKNPVWDKTCGLTGPTSSFQLRGFPLNHLYRSQTLEKCHRAHIWEVQLQCGDTWGTPCPAGWVRKMHMDWESQGTSACGLKKKKLFSKINSFLRIPWIFKCLINTDTDIPHLWAELVGVSELHKSLIPAIFGLLMLGLRTCGNWIEFSMKTY